MTASPVRITDKLKNEVAESIRITYQWFLDDINKQKPNVGDQLYDLLYGPHLATMEKLPDSFFRRVRSLETRHIDGQQLSYQFELSQVRRMGYSHPQGVHVGQSDYSDKVNIYRTEATAGIVDAILTWHGRKIEIVRLREAAQKAVKGVLNTHKSLAPAVKAFPPLVDLVSHATRLRLDVPQHRLSSVQMELNPDLKRLATDIATKKFLNR